MATSAKTVSKKAPAATPKRAAKARADAEPFIRFYHSTALRDKMDATLGALEQAAHPETHRDALADLVDELTASGMDYYFLRALQLAKMGFVAEQSARLGMAGAVKLITSVSRKFIERMDAAQLLVVSRHIRDLTV